MKRQATPPLPKNLFFPAKRKGKQSLNHNEKPAMQWQAMQNTLRCTHPITIRSSNTPNMDRESESPHAINLTMQFGG